MVKKQKKLKGAEIPIPKRGDFFKNLKEAATPSPSRRPKNGCVPIFVEIGVSQPPDLKNGSRICTRINDLLSVHT